MNKTEQIIWEILQIFMLKCNIKRYCTIFIGNVEYFSVFNAI